jgi:hypothetical protein
MTIIRLPVDDAPPDPTSSDAGDKTTKSIITLLRPHTGMSSEELTSIAHAIACLTVGNFCDDELHNLLNRYLDTLAISPQAKRGLIVALMGLRKVIGVQSRG